MDAGRYIWQCGSNFIIGLLCLSSSEIRCRRLNVESIYTILASEIISNRRIFSSNIVSSFSRKCRCLSFKLDAVLEIQISLSFSYPFSLEMPGLFLSTNNA